MAMMMSAGTKGTKSHMATVAVPIRCKEGCADCPVEALDSTATSVVLGLWNRIQGRVVDSYWAIYR